MYLRHFNLTAEPFALTPDPAFLFASEVHSEALAALKLGLLERRGLIVMVGEVGTGKTTLLYSLLSSLGPQIRTAFVPNSMLSFDGMLRAALKDFGITPQGPTRLDLLNSLNDFLRRCDEENATAAIVIDEAQNLSDAAFEELRLLSNYETYKHKLLQIVLVGQPELDTKLNKPELRQVRERIAVRCVVNPLTPSECQDYIAHRLGEVGGSVKIFERAALKQIIKESQGIPRRINILCHNTMLYAFGRDLPRISKRLVTTAMRERQGSDLVRVSRKGIGGWLERLNDAMNSRFSIGLAWTAAGLAIGALGTVALLSADSPSTNTTPTTVVAEKSPVAPEAPDAVQEEAAESAAGSVVSDSDSESPVAHSSDDAVDTVVTAIGEQDPTTGEVRYEPVAPEQALALPSADTDTVAEVVAEAPAPAQPSTDPVVEDKAGDEPVTAVDTQDEPAAASDTGDEPESAAETQGEPAADSEAGDEAKPAAETQEELAAETAAEEAQPADRTEPASPEDAVAATPSPDEKPTAVATEAPESDKVVRIKPGNTLFDLSRDVYGGYSTAIMKRIREANPQLDNPDFIRVGDRIRFPAGDKAAGTDGSQAATEKEEPAISEADRRLFEDFKAKAEKGEVRAQYNLGVLYHRGTGVQQSYILAAHWYRIAALEGLDVAQNNLGYMYEAGAGVDEDPSKAAHWYRKAADQGYTKAQLNLCELYRDGRGVAKDLATAYRWCDQAAASGDPAAIEERDRIARQLSPASIERIRSTGPSPTDSTLRVAGDRTRLAESRVEDGGAGDKQYE